eukprot:TRINITY_DN14145_c0_g2_i2.p1 TRINITY_DN14145_c0_g2~~TRINITY_DN14145_c0_g2_i2.p1  ORF type:complete len:442 (-),score=48.75 TRINITY_DN14145_c0_g2_i2:242-1567(-)
MMKHLGKTGMLTLSIIRHGLDNAMLECLQSGRHPPAGDQVSIDATLLQAVLAGLIKCTQWVVKNLKGIDVLKPFSRAILKHVAARTQKTIVAAGGKPIPHTSPLFPTWQLGGWSLIFSKNVVQLAIALGSWRIAKLLSSPNSAIDRLGRSVVQYVQARGSPVISDTDLPLDVPGAARSSVEHLAPSGQILCDGEWVSRVGLGWSEETSFERYNRCDFDVVETLTREDFQLKYHDMGRPVLVKNFIPEHERCMLSKIRIQSQHGKDTFSYGPTAYPSITGSHHCSSKSTVMQAEHGLECAEHPGVSNYHASHGEQVFAKVTNTNTFKKLADIIDGVDPVTPQYFWGGDKSGATLHYHRAAFNLLWAGQKDWFLTSPMLAGWAGIPSFQLWNRSGIDMDHIFRCSQHAGDLILLPDMWGHSTLSHGFSAGVGVLYAVRSSNEH